MSKHEKQIIAYQKQSRNMFLTLNISMAVVAMNAVVVTSGIADRYYASAFKWISNIL